MELKTSVATDPRLAELVRRLVEAVHPQKIYLFGSRARGDARPDSDYDVMLIVDEGPERLVELESRAYKSLWGFGQSVDVIVMDQPFYMRRRIVKPSLPGSVDREGILLYDA